MSSDRHGEFLIRVVRLRQFNSYLVREADGFTVVDTGLPGSAPHILGAAAALGLPIRRIVLTHAHGDHVGSLDALHAVHPEAEVLISTREARLLSGDLSLDPDEPQTKVRGGFPKVQTRPGRLLGDGDRVGSLQVVASPGHTPGHIALLDTRDGTLIAGDAFQTAGGVAVAGMVRPLFPLPALACWHLPTALESARRLLALKPSRLAVGHGRVLESPNAAMQQAIQAAERKLGL